MGEVRRNVEQGPRLRGCDRGGAHEHAGIRRMHPAAGSHPLAKANGILLRPPRAQGGGKMDGEINR